MWAGQGSVSSDGARAMSWWSNNLCAVEVPQGISQSLSLHALGAVACMQQAVDLGVRLARSGRMPVQLIAHVTAQICYSSWHGRL
jgi:hypothetical protein